jgi:hypothetical protein
VGEYGNAGDFLHTGVYWEPEMPKLADIQAKVDSLPDSYFLAMTETSESGSDNDGEQQVEGESSDDEEEVRATKLKAMRATTVRTLYSKALDLYYKQLDDAISARPKMYAIMVRYTDINAEAELRADPKYEKIEKQRDPLKYWLMVERRLGTSSSKNAADVQSKAREAYDKAMQGTQDLVKFYKRFQNIIKQLETVGITYSDSLYSMDFLKKLNSGYAAARDLVVHVRAPAGESVWTKNAASEVEWLLPF